MMKTILIILLLSLVSVGLTFAQDVESFIFTGIEYDDVAGAAGTIGAAKNLSGGLWIFPRTVIGRYGSLETDMAYFFKVPAGGLYLGLVAGPGVDWTDPEDGDHLSYIVGGTGLIAGYKWDKIALGIGAKYKFALDEGNFYQSGWQGGLWTAFAFGGE